MSWIHKFNQKLDGKLAGTTFVHSEQQLDLSEWFDWEVWNITNGTDDLERLLLSYRKNSKYEHYTAPATNNEEANSVFKTLIGYER